MFAWFRALHIRERYIRQWLAERDAAEERMHRIEMENRRQGERLDHLEAAQASLMARWKGSRGGRPRLPEEPQEPSDVKAALRRQVGLVPGRPAPIRIANPQE